MCQGAVRRSELHSACPRCNSQTWYAHATAIAANLSTLPFFELEEAWLRYKLAAALLANDHGRLWSHVI